MLPSPRRISPRSRRRTRRDRWLASSKPRLRRANPVRIAGTERDAMLRGTRGTVLVGAIVALLCVAPVLATPKVVTLGGGNTTSDPVAACGDLAASPDEDSREGRGVSDDQVF